MPKTYLSLCIQDISLEKQRQLLILWTLHLTGADERQLNKYKNKSTADHHDAMEKVSTGVAGHPGQPL